MDLAHIVVAMQGDQIKKVQCNTCKGFHGFRAPKGVTSPTKTKKKSTAPAKVSVESEWERLMKINSGSPTKNYNPKSQFSVGDRLSHPVFGDGIVGKLIHPNKLEIVFRTDVKILIHSMA